MAARALIALFVLLGAGVGSALPAAAARVDPALDRELAIRPGHVAPVIVTLALRPRPEAQLQPGAVAAQRSAIRRSGDRVLSLTRSPGTVLTTFPYVVTSLNRAGLRRLRSSSLIRAVTLSVPVLAPRVGSAPVTPRASAAQAAADALDHGTGAAVAWAAGILGRGQGIAVLDSGVDFKHRWLKTNRGAEACFSGATDAGGVFGLCPDTAPNDDGDPSASSGGPSFTSGPSYGPGSAAPPMKAAQALGRTYDPAHGTLVTGAAAGADQRLLGFPVGPRGIAPDARVVAVNVNSINRDDPSSGGDIHLGDLVAGLDWVNDQRVSENLAVVNLSLGLVSGGSVNTSCDDSARRNPARQLLADSINTTISNGVTVVAAAGNGRTDPINFPACLNRVISVGTSVTGQNVPASNTPTGSILNMLAPGTDIEVPQPGGGTRVVRGSSISAAMVSGAVALYRQQHPNATPVEIKTRLMQTGNKVPMGFGRTRRSLRVDQLLGLKASGPTGSVNEECMSLEFVAPTEVRPRVRRGFLRLSCAPTRRAPGRLVVTVEGPNNQLDKEISGADVPLERPAFYAGRPVVFGPVQAITTVPSAEYQVCYLLYGAGDTIKPIAGACETYNTDEDGELR